MDALTHRLMMAAEKRVVEISHTDSGIDPVNRTIYTFTKSFGAAAPDRKIPVEIVANAANPGRTIVSVTIGGISAAVATDGVTNAFADGGGAGTTRLSAIYEAAVPTGTAGDIVIEFSTAMTDCAIAVKRLVGAGDVFDVQTDITISTDALSVAIDVPSGGAAIGVIDMGGTATRTCAWDGLTEDVDAEIESPRSYSSASEAFSAEQSGLAVEAQASGTLALGALVAASWGPA